MDQFWEWLGRADALVGVIQFMIGVVTAVWIGTAAKARAQTPAHVHAVKEYIPISELKGMDRIKAEIADWLIRPEQSVFVDFAGIIFGCSLPIMIIWIRSRSHEPVFHLHIFDIYQEFEPYIVGEAFLLSVLLIIKFLAGAIWKLKG